MSDYQNVKVGDKILFGRYPQEAAGAKRREGIIKLSLNEDVDPAQKCDSHADALVVKEAGLHIVMKRILCP